MVLGEWGPRILRRPLGPISNLRGLSGLHGHQVSLTTGSSRPQILPSCHGRAVSAATHNDDDGGRSYKEARRLRKNKKKTGQWARAAMYSPRPGGKIFISETKQLSYSITKRKAFHSLKEQGQRWYIGILLHAVEIIYNFIIK